MKIKSLVIVAGLLTSFHDINQNVKLSVFNVLGQLVERLVDGNLIAGTHVYRFDAKNLASGIYFCQLRTASYVGISKMLLLK